MFQTFCPLTIHSSPSRMARVPSPAKSDPAPGSENSWHQRSSPVNIGRRKRCFTSSLPWVAIVGPARAMKNVRGSVGAAPASRRRRSTTPVQLRPHPEAAAALREVHPRQPGVELRAAELAVVHRRRVVGGEERVHRRRDPLRPRHRFQQQAHRRRSSIQCRRPTPERPSPDPSAAGLLGRHVPALRRRPVDDGPDEHPEGDRHDRAEHGRQLVLAAAHRVAEQLGDADQARRARHQRQNAGRNVTIDGGPVGVRAMVNARGVLTSAPKNPLSSPPKNRCRSSARRR